MKTDVKITDNRVQLTRVFNATRERVFDAWKQVDKLQQWWGCRNTTRVEAQIDFRVGGAFSFKSTIEGAGEMSASCIYDEIIEPEKIAYHGEFGGMTMRVTVEFFTEGAGTRLVVTQEGFPAPEIRPIVAQGLTDALDKLEQLLQR